MLYLKVLFQGSQNNQMLSNTGCGMKRLQPLKNQTSFKEFRGNNYKSILQPQTSAGSQTAPLSVQHFLSSLFPWTK